MRRLQNSPWVNIRYLLEYTPHVFFVFFLLAVFFCSSTVLFFHRFVLVSFVLVGSAQFVSALEEELPVCLDVSQLWMLEYFGGLSNIF